MESKDLSCDIVEKNVDENTNAGDLMPGMASQLDHILESDAKTVIKWCVECSKFICDDCVQAHQRYTKDHTIKAIEVAFKNPLAAGSEKCLFDPVHQQIQPVDDNEALFKRYWIRVVGFILGCCISFSLFFILFLITSAFMSVYKKTLS